MSTGEKREFENAGPPKTQERLELKGANSNRNGNGGALFKSVYPSSHGNSTTQVAVSSKPRGEQKEAELPAMPAPESVFPEKYKNYFSIKNVRKRFK